MQIDVTDQRKDLLGTSEGEDGANTNPELPWLVCDHQQEETMDE
jgi:hypothetical protein